MANADDANQSARDLRYGTGKELVVGFATAILEDVRSKIAPDDRVLAAARDRLEAVLKAAGRFSGVLRTYRSGSVPHRTANKPLDDADGGVVLDRRGYPDLGPDGAGVGPADTVDQVANTIVPILKETYPNVVVSRTKRAILVEFREPIGDQDPSVDLIVALTRKEEPGLWIPNIEAGCWDASDPEAHTDLILAANQKTKHTLTRVLRLAKAWNRQYKKPALSSFNLEALAMEAIKEEVDLMSGLATLLRYSADALANGETEDPAGVSPPIRVEDLAAAVARLAEASGYAETAMGAENDEPVAQEALSNLFFEWVEPAKSSASKAGLAAALSLGNSAVRIGSGGAVASVAVGRMVKPTRSSGDGAIK